MMDEKKLERQDGGCDNESSTSMLETDPEIAENQAEDRYLIMGFDQGQVIIFDMM